MRKYFADQEGDHAAIASGATAVRHHSAVGTRPCPRSGVNGTLTYYLLARSRRIAVAAARRRHRLTGLRQNGRPLYGVLDRDRVTRLDLIELRKLVP